MNGITLSHPTRRLLRLPEVESIVRKSSRRFTPTLPSRSRSRSDHVRRRGSRPRSSRGSTRGSKHHASTGRLQRDTPSPAVSRNRSTQREEDAGTRVRG